MSELDLYKFLESDAVDQYNWEGEQFLVWVSLCSIRQFTDLIGHNFLSDA